MTITLSSRKTSVRDAFRERVEKKLQKLDRFFGADANANVTVTREGDRDTVEVTILSGGMFFRAEKTAPEREDALEAVVDALFKQITRNKSRLEKKFRTGAFQQELPEGPTDEAAEEETYGIVRIKKFPVKPMSVQEAILQMNMLGHSFFMFRDEDSNQIQLVYRRVNGDYGLLEPTD